MRKLLAAVSAALVLVGCGSGSGDTSSDEPAPSPEPEKVEASAVVVALDPIAVVDKALGNEVVDRCDEWQGEYRELREGATVVVRGGDDEIVGTGKLGPGTFLPGLPACQWGAEVEVESEAGYYYAELLRWESDPIEETELTETNMMITIDGAS